jgi:dTDP-4-dehydrorhamnose 3,5-epimerase
MRLHPTTVEGAFVIEPEANEDARGLFARTFDAAAFSRHGLETSVAECSVAFNHVRGTLRGLHYQRPPHEETKLVRCTRGAAFDVAVDLRGDSPSYLRWAGVELTAESRRAFYIPRGCAHGYVTLTDGCELAYQISTPHTPEAAAGVRWNDPAFGIEWPVEPLVMSDRDASYPDLA